MIRFEVYERTQLLIHLNTSDKSVVNAVYSKIEEQFPDSTIHTDHSLVYSYVPGEGEHVLTWDKVLPPDDTVGHRRFHLWMASLGGRLWIPSKDDKFISPWLAEALDEVVDVRQIVADAVYAEGRAAYYRSFGVNYLGRVFSDPRTMVLMDNKRGNTFDQEHMGDILSSFPESTNPEVGSWTNLAFVSAGNVDKLEEFLDYLSETNVVAYSTGAFAKLNFIGRDYGVIPAPRQDPKYGLEVREVSSRMKPQLSL